MTSLRIRHVNFLEEKERGRKGAFTLNYFWILVIVAAIGAVGGSYSLFQKSRINKLQAERDAINTELASLREVQAKEQQKQQSSAKLKEVLSDPVLWSDLLKQVTKKIPNSIKLVHVSGRITDKRTLIVRGHSSFMLPVFRLKDSMSTLKGCERASLVSVEQSSGEKGEEPLTFQMECTLL